MFFYYCAESCFYIQCEEIFTNDAICLRWEKLTATSTLKLITSAFCAGELAMKIYLNVESA